MVRGSLLVIVLFRAIIADLIEENLTHEKTSGDSTKSSEILFFPDKDQTNPFSSRGGGSFIKYYLALFVVPVASKIPLSLLTLRGGHHSDETENSFLFPISRPTNHGRNVRQSAKKALSFPIEM